MIFCSSQNVPRMNYENHGLISVTFSRIIAMSSALEAPRFSLRTLSLSNGRFFKPIKFCLPKKERKKGIFFQSSFRLFLPCHPPPFTIKYFNYCELQVKLQSSAIYPGLETAAITTQLAGRESSRVQAPNASALHN